METRSVALIVLLSVAAVLMIISTGSPLPIDGVPDFSADVNTVKSVPSAIGEGGALLLLTGGLLVLLIMLPITLLKSIHTEAQHEPVKNGGASNGSNGSNGSGKYDLGYKVGASVSSQNIDDIVDSLEQLQDTEVSITNTTGKLKRIHVKKCKTCRNPVCDFERGFFAGAFGQFYDNVSVKETKCRATGAGYCEFEVKG
ncbi:MAG: hypothetical protein HYS81_01780 [Candidatus Aenigmatarchaeota archaeon]|nr:MAG: hypothetical protein HYS81_01780 [Candidatus Aenigmarchaeota archaeon]